MKYGWKKMTEEEDDRIEWNEDRIARKELTQKQMIGHDNCRPCWRISPATRDHKYPIFNQTCD